ncbi:hypothetical protein [Streptomyces endophyticus]|uniref:Nuclear transport factor 2 family protein n=1 Tax=Streptomyces endophyticus TaxID=714166 RepID=A0ABU6F7B2_9ACTN|nr:hypothetical protein [Streptomyces endophyticus]MEB8339907.1 hypothetical protein [Streptomyces endophyticus]
MPTSPSLRAAATALLTCALLAGVVGCGGDGGGPRNAGEVLSRTDGAGHHYRRVPKEGAPEIGLIVKPETGPAGGWEVRIWIRRFRLSPQGTPARAIKGHGYARLYLDGRSLARLRAVDYRLPGTRLHRGTHHLTARLYADDHTVWAVADKPVQATADLTASP